MINISLGPKIKLELKPKIKLKLKSKPKPKLKLKSLIPTSSSLSRCSSKKKTINDYRQLAINMGYEYILADIPQYTKTCIAGWKCSTGHIRTTSYHIIRMGTKCGHCIYPSKTLNDYKLLAENKGGKYILDKIPQNTRSCVMGWSCNKCDYIWRATYSDIQQGNWCLNCYGHVPKTIEDYRKLAQEKGGDYICDTIPKNASTSTDGWYCNKGHTWKSTYSNIQYKTWCGACLKLTIDDYQALARSRGGEYILAYIPQNTNTTSTGWKCNEGHIWQACYGNIQQGTWCPQCSEFKSESSAREIIEKLMEMPFPKDRPDFLLYKTGYKLELDGYNQKHGYAFERQGSQHERYHPHFHNNDIKNFESQKERDKFKVTSCLNKGISLMVIPSKYSCANLDKMEIYIKEQIGLLGWKRDSFTT